MNQFTYHPSFPILFHVLLSVLQLAQNLCPDKISYIKIFTKQQQEFTTTILTQKTPGVLNLPAAPPLSRRINTMQIVINIMFSIESSRVKD